jgi:hypothetical protein
LVPSSLELDDLEFTDVTVDDDELSRRMYEDIVAKFRRTG